MNPVTSTGLTRTKPLDSFYRQTARHAARKAPAQSLPFISAALPAKRYTSTDVNDVSKRQALQQLVLAAATLSLDLAVHTSAPQKAKAALVQFPAADLRNTYYLVCLIRELPASVKGRSWFAARPCISCALSRVLFECSDLSSVCSSARLP